MTKLAPEWVELATQWSEAQSDEQLFMHIYNIFNNINKLPKCMNYYVACISFADI